METQIQEPTSEKTTTRKKPNAPIVVPPLEAKPVDQASLGPVESMQVGEITLQVSGDTPPVLSREAIDAGAKVMDNLNYVQAPTAERLLNECLSRISTLELQILNMTVPTPDRENTEDSISATMVGGIFNCPECGLRITSPALISTQGKLNGGYYEHPFDDSPRLAGQKCRLIGKKFQSPIVTLKFVNPTNLTAKS